MPASDYGNVGILSAINGTCQRVEYDESAATEIAFTTNRAYEVTTTTDCHMRHGTGATITANRKDVFLVARLPRQFQAKSGERVAFIKATGSAPGVAYVTEVQF